MMPSANVGDYASETLHNSESLGFEFSFSSDCFFVVCAIKNYNYDKILKYTEFSIKHMRNNSVFSRFGSNSFV